MAEAGAHAIRDARVVAAAWVSAVVHTGEVRRVGRRDGALPPEGRGRVAGTVLLQAGVAAVVLGHLSVPVPVLGTLSLKAVPAVVAGLHDLGVGHDPQLVRRGRGGDVLEVAVARRPVVAVLGQLIDCDDRALE